MTINRTKQAAFGFVTAISGQFLVTLVTFIVTPIILHFTSQSLYGFWVTVLSILVYLGLVDLGVGISLTHLTAGLYGQSKDDEFNRVVSSAFFTFCFTGLLFAAIGLSIVKYIPLWFKIPEKEASDVISAYRIIIISGALALPLSTFHAIVASAQRMGFNNIVKTLSALSGFVVMLFLLYNGFGLLSLAISNLFTTLVTGAAIYFLGVRRHYRQLKIRPALVNKTDLKRLWSFGGYYQLGRIAYMVTINTDAVLIALMIGAAAVTPYALTSKIAILISVTVASKLPIAIFPALSQMFANREYDKLRRAYIGLAYYSTRIAVVGSLLLIIANRQFISQWVGPELFGGTVLNIVFVSWVLLDTIFRGTGIIVVASGDLRNWAIASVVEAVLNIGISLALVRSLGLIGIALGTTISRMLTTDLYIPFLACRKLDLSIWTFVYKGVICSLLRSIPTCCIVILFASLIPRELGWLWLFSVATIAVVTNIISFEGLQFIRLSGESFKSRFRKILTLESVLY